MKRKLVDYSSSSGSDSDDDDRRRSIINDHHSRLLQQGYSVNLPSIKPEIKFTFVKEFEPRNLNKFHRQIFKKTFKAEHNFNQLDILLAGNEIDSAFENLLREVIEKASDNDQVSVSLSNSSLQKPIFVSYKKSHFQLKEIVNRLSERVQSKKFEGLKLAQTFDIEVSITKRISGSGSHTALKNNNRCMPLNPSELAKRKKCVTSVTNADNACGYWAVILARQKKRNMSTQEWQLLSKNRRGRLETHARLMCMGAEVSYDEPMTRLEMIKIDSYLKPEFQLICLDGNDHRNRVFIGEQAKQTIYIEHYDNHYNAITGSIKAYIGCENFCEMCWKSFDKRRPHRCPDCCPHCLSLPKCKEDGSDLSCKKCKRMFNNQSCFNKHMSKTCHYMKRCIKCEVEYNSRAPHKCNEVYCGSCKQFSVLKHDCVITPQNEQKIKKQDIRRKIIVSFDIESRLDKNTKGYFEHSPNLLVALICCDTCYNDEKNKKMYARCSFCGDYEKYFKGDKCVSEFGDFLYKSLARKAEKLDAKIYVFAHNFQGYDGHFVLTDLFDRSYTTKPILSGSKIMKIEVGNVRFIDSLNLFQMPLANLPKSFGFEKIALKGYFPYLFNTTENQGYVGPIPRQEFFNPDMMSSPAKQQFNHWYSGLKDKKDWSIDEEMLKYCRNDTLILMLAVMKFRILFKDITGIDPITRCFTLASIGLETYRSKFITDQVIGITPVVGYASRRSSNEGNAWLDWVEYKTKKSLKHERRFGRYFADAYDVETNTVYEYNGCYYHGCIECYPNRSETVNDTTVEELYSHLQEKLAYYERQNLNVVSIWSHEMYNQMNEDHGMKDFINDRMDFYRELSQHGHASIRASFFGGRTNNLKFHYDCSNDSSSQIAYLDVTSEYPYVLKNRLYPVGHPEVINQEIDLERLNPASENQYFGFVKCRILPPTQLYLPVLPSRYDEKLMFVLCNTCAQSSNDFSSHLTSCSHSDEERCLEGTWTTAEINKAVDLGYRIQDVYEVLHYNTSSSDLFTGYIDMWLKIKQESSGFPTQNMTGEEMDEYINEYWEKERVKLNKDDIKKNPGKRSIAKLMLNSFWGKLSQRPNLPRTEICKNYHEYMKLIDDPKVRVLGEYCPNDSTILVSHELVNDEDGSPGNTSIAIASFVTSYGRLHLYSFLEKIIAIGQDRLLYFDTDSMIFIQKPGDPIIPTGNFLGDLSNELADYGTQCRCVKFVSCGPKNYGYELEITNPDTGMKEKKTIIKTKGIKHNTETLKLINIEEMTRIAKIYYDTGVSPQLNVDQLRFVSHSFEHYVRSDIVPKIYRAVSTKRRIVGNDTLPYGWVD